MLTQGALGTAPREESNHCDLVPRTDSTIRYNPRQEPTLPNERPALQSVNVCATREPVRHEKKKGTTTTIQNTAVGAKARLYSQGQRLPLSSFLSFRS